MESQKRKKTIEGESRSSSSLTSKVGEVSRTGEFPLDSNKSSRKTTKAAQYPGGVSLEHTTYSPNHGKNTSEMAQNFENYLDGEIESSKDKSIRAKSLSAVRPTTELVVINAQQKKKQVDKRPVSAPTINFDKVAESSYLDGYERQKALEEVRHQQQQKEFDDFMRHCDSIISRGSSTHNSRSILKESYSRQYDENAKRKQEVRPESQSSSPRRSKSSSKVDLNRSNSTTRSSYSGHRHHGLKSERGYVPEFKDISPRRWQGKSLSIELRKTGKDETELVKRRHFLEKFNQLNVYDVSAQHNFANIFYRLLRSYIRVYAEIFLAPQGGIKPPAFAQDFFAEMYEISLFLKVGYSKVKLDSTKKQEVRQIYCRNKGLDLLLQYKFDRTDAGSKIQSYIESSHGRELGDRSGLYLLKDLLLIIHEYGTKLNDEYKRYFKDRKSDPHYPLDRVIQPCSYDSTIAPLIGRCADYLVDPRSKQYKRDEKSLESLIVNHIGDDITEKFKDDLIGNNMSEKAVKSKGSRPPENRMSTSDGTHFYTPNRPKRPPQLLQQRVNDESRTVSDGSQIGLKSTRPIVRSFSSPSVVRSSHSDQNGIGMVLDGKKPVTASSIFSQMRSDFELVRKRPPQIRANTSFYISSPIGDNKKDAVVETLQDDLYHTQFPEYQKIAEQEENDILEQSLEVGRGLSSGTVQYKTPTQSPDRSSRANGFNYYQEESPLSSQLSEATALSMAAETNIDRLLAELNLASAVKRQIKKATQNDIEESVAMSMRSVQVGLNKTQEAVFTTIEEDIAAWLGEDWNDQEDIQAYLEEQGIDPADYKVSDYVIYLLGGFVEGDEFKEFREIVLGNIVIQRDDIVKLNRDVIREELNLTGFEALNMSDVSFNRSYLGDDELSLKVLRQFKRISYNIKHLDAEALADIERQFFNKVLKPVYSEKVINITDFAEHFSRTIIEFETRYQGDYTIDGISKIVEKSYVNILEGFFELCPSVGGGINLSNALIIKSLKGLEGDAYNQERISIYERIFDNIELQVNRGHEK